MNTAEKNIPLRAKFSCVEKVYMRSGGLMQYQSKIFKLHNTPSITNKI